MKYITTPDLWDPATQDALRQGNLRLQSGQWVYCGDKEHPSIFVGINKKSGTIYAAHWNGSAQRQRERYETLREAVQGSI
jgi:hypothetical protein